MTDKGFIVQLKLLILMLCLAAGAAFAQSEALVQSASPSVAPSLLFVQLLFDGRPLESKENPQFSCQSIVNHPEDRDLTATAISLLAYVTYDYPYRAQMLEFGLKHFFDFHQRTNNCANCKVGDTANNMVADLSKIYISEGRYDRAIELIERLRSEREGEISNYALARTISLLGEAYWRAGIRQQAIEVMTQAAKKYGNNPEAERLKTKIENYQKEIENASR